MGYLILDILGAGTFGRVYRAKDEETILALKVIQLTSDFELAFQVNAILNEINLIESLDHPNVVKLVGKAFMHGNAFVLPLEFCDGGSLLDRIQRSKNSQQPISVEELDRIFLESAKGIQYLHENGIIHRDVKPANILMTRDGQIKVADFGLSKQMNGEGKTYTVVGTRMYMAPEVEYGYDNKVDVYSLGIMISKIVTKNLNMCIAYDCSDFDKYYELIDLMTQHRSDERISMDEVVARLEEFAQHHAQQNQDHDELDCGSVSSHSLEHVSSSPEDGAQVHLGSQIQKEWVFMNSGDLPWPEGCKLVKLSGDFEDVQFPLPVANPGEQVSLTITLQVPKDIETPLPPCYIGYWRAALPNGRLFGHRVWVDVELLP